MQLPVAILITTTLAVVRVSASPVSSDVSPDISSNPLIPRQGNYWGDDQCNSAAGGTVVGGSTLWMLRNTWNNHFNGDFGGSLEVGGDLEKGVCCWGQCLWVSCRGSSREWNGDQWGDALSSLTDVVGDRGSGLCGAKINGDRYLILMSSQHDAVSVGGSKVGEFFGDTCNGNPPW